MVLADLAITVPFYLGVGVFAGVMAGLLGVGGGIIIVPALAWMLQLQGVSDSVTMHMAIGTSLATIAITSISSVRAHHRHGAVLWSVFWRLTPGIVIGALLGAVIANALPSATLRIVFGVFLLLISVQMGFGAKPAPHRVLPDTPGMLAVGGVVGAVSAVVGIGGGSLTVPFLSWCNVSIRNAVATSAAGGVPIALAGTLGFVVTGWHNPDLPAWSGGYIYLPGFLGVSFVSMLFAPVGAKLTHTLPTDTLKKVFAGFLALVGVNMLLG